MVKERSTSGCASALVGVPDDPLRSRWAAGRRHQRDEARNREFLHRVEFLLGLQRARNQRGRQYLLEFLSNVGANELTAIGSEPETAAAIDGDKPTRETDGDKVRVRESAAPLRISFEFKDPNAQTQMRIAGDTSYDYKYIVMPLRI